MLFQPKVVAIYCPSTVTYVKTVCGLNLGATGEAPHRINTLVSNLRKAKKLKNLLFSLRVNPQRKRHTIWELWEACTDTIHIMDKGRKRVKKTPKPNLTKSQNTSVFAKIKQWLPPAHFTSAASVSTFSHTLFTQGITSIAEKVHCKKHSWL